MRYSYLRKQEGPNPIDLRHRQFASELNIEHVPQALLEMFRIDRVRHLVLADHETLGQHVTQLLRFKLVACDIGQDDAVAPRETQAAGVGAVGVVEKLPVPLQYVDNSMSVST